MPRRRFERARRRSGDDTGAVLVLVVAMMVVFMFMAALALDIGKQGLLKARMQHTAELAAQAGAGAYDRQFLAEEGIPGFQPGVAEVLAGQYFELNQPDNVTISGVQIVVLDDRKGCVDGCGAFGTTYFSPTVVVRATATTRRPFFAQFLGRDSLSVNVEAAATLQLGQFAYS